MSFLRSIKILVRYVIPCMALLVALATPAAAARPPAPWAEGGASRPDDLLITLATFGPGQEQDVAAWFGHTAIGVEDRRLRQKRLYNYGMFNFDRDMLVRFVMGRLRFWVAPTGYDGTLTLYKRQDRDVRVLELNLPADKRAEIARFLEKNILEENRYYLYHHYADNCATRIRDAIDGAVDGQFHEATSDAARMTLRGHTRRHARWGIIDFGMMYTMNHDIDQPIAKWDEMFLPSELERQVKAFTYIDEGR